MIHELIDLIDRSWDVLQNESDVDFAFGCFPFFAQLRRDPRISVLLLDFQREESESWALLDQADQDARTALEQVIHQLEQTTPTPFPGPPQDEDDIDHSAPALRRWLAPPAPVEDEDNEPWIAGYEDKADSTIDAVLDALDDIANAVEIKQRLQQIRRMWAHARRVRRLAHRVSAGAALARIDRDLRDLHPADREEGRRAGLWRLSRIRRGGLAHLVDALFGNRKLRVIDGTHEEELGRYVQRMRSDVRRIFEEIRRRLGAERSLLAIFERYRQRCQWYKMETLQEIAAHGRGKAEDRLTDTLATYLFDHGLNPLTRPLVGRLQPDLLGTDSRFSFYVEAKQYSRPCRTYLIRGIQQVWDMLRQLRSTEFDVHEAFYVVYRRGGPSYKFPPRLVSLNLVVHILEIDLAPPSERGSNASQHYIFTEAELLPKPAVDAETSRRHGR